MTTTVPNLVAPTWIYIFQRNPRCPKCGSRESSLPNWLLKLTGSQNPYVSMIYCKGGKDPTVQLHLPTGQEVEAFHICAGLLEEHMHRVCHTCHHHWLTHIRKENR